MERALRKRRLPNTDSIEELARFWDTHDLTDFEEELEEASTPVFVHRKREVLNIDLKPVEAQRLKRIARSMGVNESSVVRRWILKGLNESSELPLRARGARRTK